MLIRKAVIEYYAASQNVSHLTKAIGDSSSMCAEKQLQDNGGYLEEYVDHLRAAYSGSRGEEGEFIHDNGDPAKYLAGVCIQCLITHGFIQERKRARRRFGAAKRRITMLGKKLGDWSCE